MIGLGIALGTAALSYAFFYRNHSITRSNNTPDEQLDSKLIPSGQSGGIQITSNSPIDWEYAQKNLIDSLPSNSASTARNLASSITEAVNTKEQLGNKLLILMKGYRSLVSQAISLEKKSGNNEAPVIQEYCTDNTYEEVCNTQQDTNTDVTETQNQLTQTYSTILTTKKLADSILSTLKKIKADSERFMNKNLGIHYSGYGYHSSAEFASYAKLSEILENSNLSRAEKNIAFYNALEDQKANSPGYHTFISYIKNQCTIKKIIDHGHGNLEATTEPCSWDKSPVIADNCDSLSDELKPLCEETLPLIQKLKQQAQHTLTTLDNLAEDYRLSRIDLIGKERILGNTNAVVIDGCSDRIAIPKTCHNREGTEQEKIEAGKNIERSYEQMRDTGLFCAAALPFVQWVAGIEQKSQDYWYSGTNPRFNQPLPKLQGH